MNLTVADIAELPMACALVDRDDAVIACTPEWTGAGPGTVAYRVRSSRLLVATETTTSHRQALLDRLLAAIEDAALSVGGDQRMRVRLLATSLRLVVGRRVTTAGTASDVIAFARAGITGRTQLTVRDEHGDDATVDAPEVVALALVQLAVNAERHAHAAEVTVSHDRMAFAMRWRAAGPPGEVTTSRRHRQRQRWGLGFVRIAADAIGGGVYGPYCDGDDLVVTLELGLRRLALPLAAASGRQLVRATRTWDDETGVTPGQHIERGTPVGDALGAALRFPGEIATTTTGISARTGRALTWLAVPPDGVTDRARDVLAGLVHERSLIDGIAEPHRSRIAALALLLGAALGSPVPRVPARSWYRRMHELSTAFGVTLPLPPYDGIGAIEPSVVALLAAEAGDRFEVSADRLWLTVRSERSRDPLLAPLLEPGSLRIRIG